MIRLRISRRVLRIVGWLALVLALATGLYRLGAAVTPRNDAGRPLILSPSLRATETYRARVRKWTVRMVEVDRGLTALLAGDALVDPTELHAQSQEMREIGEEAASLAQAANATDAPVALVGLREGSQFAAAAYLEASLATARWLSGPSEAGRSEALEKLAQARSLRVELEGSRWLKTPN